MKIYPDDWAEMCKKSAGQKYQPSNGTEGECFIGAWCGNCQRDKSMREGIDTDECDDNEICGILGRSFYDINDPDYPTEWQYGDDGQPRCTAFVEAGKPIPPPKDELTIDMFAESNQIAASPEGKVS